MTPAEVERYAQLLMTDDQREEFNHCHDIDFGITVPDFGRLRINIFRQRNSCSIAVRSVLDEIPTLESLGLPPWIEEYALKQQGLIMITGPTGHGKSTTLACLVDIINSKRHCNIISIEDPIEFLHRHKQSNVNQREVGRDTESFQQGLRRIFRQAPDVIVIGEMRDPESFAIALQAAETGHLVLTTMHANFSTSAVERIVDIFPTTQQQQIRVQLAESFLLILNQRLIPRRDGRGRILAYERLTSSTRIKNLIREGKTHHIRSQLNQSSDDFQSIDIQVARFAVDGLITAEEGAKFCDNIAYFRESLARGSLRAPKRQ
jgi:twitching motility protein PilT